jgi:hypothetical protein
MSTSSNAARTAWCVVALVVASITPGAVLTDARTRDLLLRLGGKAPPPTARRRTLRVAPPRTELAGAAFTPIARRASVFRGARGDRTGG